MKKLVFLLLGVLLLNGCKEANSKKTDEDVTVIRVDLKEQDIHTSCLFSDCVPVVLETNDRSLLREISKSYLTKSYLFINSNQTLFIFNREGCFLRKIEKNGNGPEE